MHLCETKGSTPRQATVSRPCYGIELTDFTVVGSAAGAIAAVEDCTVPGVPYPGAAPKEARWLYAARRPTHH